MNEIKKHLSRAQYAEFRDYVELRKRAEREGWHHWHRIAGSRDIVEPVEVKHCIPYTQPYDLDAPIAVCHPSGRFIAELMLGGIHPPLDALQSQKLLIIGEDGKADVVDKVDAPQWRNDHGMRTEYVVQNSRAHLETEEPMSYEAAIEYTLQKDVPYKVWGKKHNRLEFRIVKREALPASRTFRNQWKMSDIGVAA
jgi:hypothetical protein